MNIIVLSDLMTMIERKGDLSALKIAYLGDLNRTLVLDLMRISSMFGMKLIAANLQNLAVPTSVSDVIDKVGDFYKICFISVNIFAVGDC